MSLSVDALRDEIELGQINTVVLGTVDMQGRLMGKRLTGKHFAESMLAKKDGDKEKEPAGMTLATYFLAMTVEGHAADSYEAMDWSSGWENGVLKPEFGTLRRTPWMDKTAILLGDPHDQKSGDPLFMSPRVILRRQVERLAKLGFRAKVASELEFHVFQESQKSAREKHWKNLETAQPHFRCLHLLASSVDEPFMRKVRDGLQSAGIYLEATHAEYHAGQQELNFIPCEPIEMADRHVLTKHAIHEMATLEGVAACFMAKYQIDGPGNACHIHMSLEHIDSGKTASYDPSDEFGMSTVLRQWIAGMVKYSSDYTYFLAPYINSYKRLQPNSWAPTKICWAIDNRTSSFRLCNQNLPGVHVECRIGGADLNPFLAYSAIIAAGMAGIEQGLELPKPADGNLYKSVEYPELPKTLWRAANLMAQSEMLKKAFGEKVVRHYENTARIELEEFEKQITEWELMRGFDRA